MWIWSNREEGDAKGPTGVRLRRVTLDFWHAIKARVHIRQLGFMEGHLVFVCHPPDCSIHSELVEAMSTVKWLGGVFLMQGWTLDVENLNKLRQKYGDSV